MKTMIIPDIHTKFQRAELVIDEEKPDRIVFLGDYFDSFFDDLEITEQTALWLKDSLEKPNRIHLLGNHDLSYFNKDYACSGFSEGKLWAIKNTKVDLSKLKHYCWVDDWLCTHAGLTKEFYHVYNHLGLNVNYFLHVMSVTPESRPRLYQCSAFRGGRDGIAGIVWCDYNEFEDIPNTKQIFGHTRGELRVTENHICLDTGLHHYAIYEDNVMTTKKIPDKFLEVIG